MLFPFNQNVRFKFSATSRCEWQKAFSKISTKEDNLARYTQIFQKFFPGVCFPFNLACSAGVFWVGETLFVFVMVMQIKLNMALSRANCALKENACTAGYIQLCFRDFWNFRLNGSHFGNSTVSGISENFSGTFLYHLPLFLNFRKFWMNGKRPSFRGETTDGVEKSWLFLRVVIPSRLSTMTLNSDTECILP